MDAGTGATVEFLDLLPPGPGAGGEAAGLDPPTGPRRRWPGAWGAVFVVTGVFAAARLLGAPPPEVPAAAAEAPVFAGEVRLPAGFGAPVRVVAAATDDDVVWALGEHGRVVRVADGRVTAVSAGTGYHGLTVRPDGRSVFVTTGRPAPTVVALDPRSLEPGAQALAAAPVTALAAGVGSVWVAAGGAVQGWTSDLRRPLRTMRLPAGVSGVSSLAVVGSRVQAVVTTVPGTSALLRLEPPGGAPQLTSASTGPVSVVPGVPALVVHVGAQRSIEVTVDPGPPGVDPVGPPLPLDASIWPGAGVGAVVWLASTRTSAALDCFDATGQLVGRMAVGDDGHGVRGPVVTTSRAVYAVTTQGELARGGHGSCGRAS